MSKNKCKNCGMILEEHQFNGNSRPIQCCNYTSSTFELQESKSSGREKNIQSNLGVNLTSTDDTFNSLTAPETAELIRDFRNWRKKKSPYFNGSTIRMEEIPLYIQQKFIPLSKHNEEIEKLNKNIFNRAIEYDKMALKIMELNKKYNELLSRINSIQEKAEKGCGKEFDCFESELKTTYCPYEITNGFGKVIRRIYCNDCQNTIKICKEIKNSEEQKR